MFQALAADDPPLHVVGRELDQRGRRLCGVARGHALKRVGHEVQGATLRLRLRLLVELADTARELVAHQLLGLLEEPRLRLVHGHAGDALELLELTLLRLLEVVLELLDVHLAVGDALLAARELLLAKLHLVFACQDTLLDLRDARALLDDLTLDLAADTDGVLAGLDLRLPPDRLGLSTGLRDARAAEQVQPEHDDHACDQDADQNCRKNEHGCSSGRSPRGSISE